MCGRNLKKSQGAQPARPLLLTGYLLSLSLSQSSETHLSRPQK